MSAEDFVFGRRCVAGRHNDSAEVVLCLGDRNLVLWAGCVMKRDLFARAEAAVAGGFSCMSVICGDLVAHERAGGSVRELARGSRRAARRSRSSTRSWPGTQGGRGRG